MSLLRIFQWFFFFFYCNFFPHLPSGKCNTSRTLVLAGLQPPPQLLSQNSAGSFVQGKEWRLVDDVMWKSDVTASPWCSKAWNPAGIGAKNKRITEMGKGRECFNETTSTQCGNPALERSLHLFREEIPVCKCTQWGGKDLWAKK